MRKKLKGLLIFLCLFVSMNSSICFADTSVKSGYYRLRNYGSDMYLTTNSSYLIQKSYPSYYLPQSFLITNMGGYGDYYSIHPKKSMAFCVTSDMISPYQITIDDAYCQDYQLWNLKYAEEGAFYFTSKLWNGYLGVSNSGISSSGARVYEFKTATSSGETRWYLEKEIEDGIYRIKNKATGKYLTASGSNLILKDETSADNQKFHIVSYSDGYSDIMPITNEAYSISVNGWANETDNENALIRLDWGQSGEGQMWRFLVNENGTLRIMSQLSDCTKGITAKSTTTYFYSCTFDEDNAYNQWELEQVSSDENKRNIFVAAFWKNGESYDRRVALTPIKEYYESNNSANIVTIISGVNSSNELLSAMKENEVVSIDSHGSSSSIAAYDENGTYKGSLLKSTIASCSDEELSDLKICLMSGCETAKGSGSITETIYNKGAQCAIGFEESTMRPKSITWVKSFNELIAKGGNVELALGYADWYVITTYGSTGNTDTYRAFGNTNVVLGD